MAANATSRVLVERKPWSIHSGWAIGGQLEVSELLGVDEALALIVGL